MLMQKSLMLSQKLLMLSQKSTTDKCLAITQQENDSFDMKAEQVKYTFMSQIILRQ